MENNKKRKHSDISEAVTEATLISRGARNYVLWMKAKAARQHLTRAASYSIIKFWKVVDNLSVFKRFYKIPFIRIYSGSVGKYKQLPE